MDEPPIICVEHSSNLYLTTESVAGSNTDHKQLQDDGCYDSAVDHMPEESLRLRPSNGVCPDNTACDARANLNTNALFATPLPQNNARDGGVEDVLLVDVSTQDDRYECRTGDIAFEGGVPYATVRGGTAVVAEEGGYLIRSYLTNLVQY